MFCFYHLKINATNLIPFQNKVRVLIQCSPYIFHLILDSNTGPACLSLPVEIPVEVVVDFEGEDEDVVGGEDLSGLTLGTVEAINGTKESSQH